MRFRRCFLIVALILMIGSANADLSITVHPDNGWGGAPIANIQKLCENVVSHYQEHLREEHKLKGHINVYYDSSGPFVIGGKDIYISAKGGNLAQFIYQFSHEVTHILHHHHITSPGNPNLWFHESICMMSSIWVLNEMSKTWADNPPYAKWKIYRYNLSNYAEDNMNREGVYYNGTASEWLKEWESFLRTTHDDFSEHLTVAQFSYAHFLEIFVEHPRGWNAVRQLPASSLKISDYMFEWLDDTNGTDKEVVQLLIDAMEISDEPEAFDNSSPEIVLGEIGDYVHLTCKNKNSLDSLIPINSPNEWFGYEGLGYDIWEKYPNGTISPRNGDPDFDEMHALSHWISTHAPAILSYDISSLPVLYFSAYILLPNSKCHGAASVEIIVLADDAEIFSKEVYLKNSGIHIEFDIPTNTANFDFLIGDLGSKKCDTVILGEPKIYINNTSIDADVNDDGNVDLQDVKLVRSAMEKDSKFDTDVNDDGVTNEFDLKIVKRKAIQAIVAASPQKQKNNLTTWGAMKRR